MTTLIERVKSELAKANEDAAAYRQALANCDYDINYEWLVVNTRKKRQVLALVSHLKDLLRAHESSIITRAMEKISLAQPYRSTVANMGQKLPAMPFEVRFQIELELARSRYNHDDLMKPVRARQAKGDALGALQQSMSVNAADTLIESLQRIWTEHEAEGIREFLISPEQIAVKPTAATDAQRQQAITALNAATAREGTLAAAQLLVS